MTKEPELEEIGPPLHGDSAKRELRDDAFGLSEFALGLSEVVRSRAGQDGYAIGIEGPWGCGKSTILNFVEEILRHRTVTYQQIIRFEPWLIGNKEALLSTYLANLLRAMSSLRVELEAAHGLPPEQRKLFDSVTVRIAQYSKYLTFAGEGSTLLAEFDHTGLGKMAARFVKFLAWLAKLSVKAPLSLEELKNKIVDDLRKIAYYIPNARITVLIDDTDRLDPNEAVEILRLIKAVANFPLLTYLVCFDRRILAEQVHIALNASGDEYLEKIFQQIVPVPPQEPFALRRFFRRQLAEVFPEEMMSITLGQYDLEDRQNIVFDGWLGKFLETPRDAIRLLDAIKYGWPHLKKYKLDFLDYIWLQVIKLNCRPLYDWLKDYVSNLGSYRDNGRPGNEEPARDARRLSEVLTRFGWSEKPYRSGIEHMLPGLKNFSGGDAGSIVFKFEPANEWAKYEAGRRLGSPSHWRFYFAFSKPSYALGDAEITGFLSAASTKSQQGTAYLRSLLEKEHSTKGHYVEVLLDRLNDYPIEFTDDHQIGMTMAFVEVMDDVPVRPFGVTDAWRLASRLLGKAVGPHFAEIVAKGKSINWIAHVMRDQGFALGVINPNQSDPNDQWMTLEEFDRAKLETFRRFRELGMPAIFDTPFPGQILWCWILLGGKDELIASLKVAMQSDEMFVKGLAAMRIWVDSSSRGLYQRLERQTVAELLDEPAARQRLVGLQGAANLPSEQQKLVKELLDTWDER